MSKQLLLEHQFVSLENCHSKCDCNNKKYSNKEYVDVIMTFESTSQMHFEIKVPHKLSEEDFIGFIISTLDKDQLLDLIKISLCLYYAIGMHCYDYIFQTNGKYYFNINVNNDPETHKWNNYRNNIAAENYIPSIVSQNAIIKHRLKPEPIQTKEFISLEELLQQQQQENKQQDIENSLTQKLKDMVSIFETNKTNGIDYFQVSYFGSKGNHMILYLNVCEDLGEEHLVKYLLSILSKNKLKTIKSITLKFINNSNLNKFKFLPKSNTRTYDFDCNLIDDKETIYWNTLRKSILSTYTPLDTIVIEKIIMFDYTGVFENITTIDYQKLCSALQNII